MIKKSGIILLILVSFSVSIYLLTSTITIDEGRYGKSEVILFSIPAIMVILICNLFFLPKLSKLKGSYARFKNGLENIFLALTFILFLLHCGLLLVTTGTELNLLLFIPIIVGITLITTANTLPRFQFEINSNTTQLTNSTNQLWNIVVRPFSIPLYIGGIVMLFCVFLPGGYMLVAFFTLLFSTLSVSIYLSYKAYLKIAN